MRIIPIGKVIGNRAVVRPIKVQEESGEFLVDIIDTSFAKLGVVIKASESTGLQSGDKIVYAPWGGTAFNFDGDLVEIVDMDDICCTYTGVAL